MSTNDEASRPWLRRTGRPTAVVMLAAAALLVLVSIVSIVDMIGSPPPPAEFQYGPFGDLDFLIGGGVLIVIFAAVGVWGATRGTEPGLSRVTAALIVCGPIGWGLGLVDSLSFNLINSIGPAGSVAAMVLLVVTFVVTVTGIVAAFAEYAASRGQRTPAP
ncbi:uncharacterized membrane protein YuzA (DUF378 family) [Dietzia sp. 2505]